MHIKFFVFTILLCSLQALHASHHIFNSFSGSVGQVNQGVQVNNGRRSGTAVNYGGGMAIGYVENLPPHSGTSTYVYSQQPQFKETIVKEFELGEEPSIALMNNVGNITISAWDKAKTLIQIIKKAALDERLAAMRVEIVEHNNSLDIRSKHEAKSNESIDYTITTPFASKIEVETNIGNISVASILGLITLLQANNGNVEVQNAACLKKVSTKVGNITVQFDTQIDSCSLTTDVGDVTVQLHENCDATIFAATNIGQINNRSNIRINQKIQGMVGASLVGKIGNGNGNLEAKTNVGDIRLS